MFAVLFLAVMARSRAANLVVIGDSLSAEYDAIPDFPGVDNPTEYARITTNGWESMSWVEVLGKLRPLDFNLGAYRADLPGWLDLRFTGYEYNFAIPGFQASQYEDIVNSQLFSNPQYLLFRGTLEDTLRQKADRVVIWLGGNELRAQYGYLYDGGDPTSLINNLIHDLTEVIQFVQDQKSTLQVVLVNLPDLGATPSKRGDHPDPKKRARVTAVTVRANQAITDLAASKQIAIADVYSVTEKMIQGQTQYIGAIALVNAASPDNDLRYEFTRDGLHPNTALQIQIARIITAAFNANFENKIPALGDAEALALLGIDPRESYLDWAARYGLTQTGMEADPDQDQLVNIVEYAFDLDPTQPSVPPVSLMTTHGQIALEYRYIPTRSSVVEIQTETSTDLSNWSVVPSADIRDSTNGFRTVTLRTDGPRGFLRLRLQVQP